MNIQTRLVAIALLIVFSHDPAAAATICVDRRVAITIGELTQQANRLLAIGERSKVAHYKQMIDQVAKAYCMQVGSYPPARTYTKIKLGCQVFSGEVGLPNGQITTVYWTDCP
jgi:hypothetical protein